MGTEPMSKNLNASAISELPEQKTTSGKFDPVLSIQRFFFTEDDGNTERTSPFPYAKNPSWNGTYIEVSIPMPDGSRKSKKFDFGKFLTYLEDSLKKLAEQSTKVYLTKTEAENYFVKKTGDVMSGPLEINNKTGTSLTAKYGIVVKNEGVTAPNITAQTSLTSSITTTLNKVSVTNSLAVKTGDLAVENGNFKVKAGGTTLLGGNTTINGNLINNNANTYSAKFNSIEAVDIDTSTLDASSKTTTKDLEATGSTSVQKLTAHNDAEFKGNATIANTGKFVVKGSVYLDNEGDSDRGKIIAGDVTKTSPYIQGKDGEIYITKATIDDAALGKATVGSESTVGDQHQLVLTVKGDINSTGSKTTASLHNINVVETAEFQDMVKADTFQGHTYQLIDAYNAAAGMSDGGGKRGAATLGIWQTKPQIAEITARAACWS